MTRLLAVVVAAAALAGCDQNTSNSLKASFDNGFNRSFDKSVHDSCITTATGKGAAADLAERYCTCVVGQLDKLSVADKMKLNQEPDKLTAAAQACQPSYSPS